MYETAIDAEIAAAEGYEALFVPALFGRWTEHVIKAAELKAGDQVLDIGCGTGILARDMLRHIGSAQKITGLDPAPGMLEVARRAAPGMVWQPGVAEALPFKPAAFDCVASQFSMMFCRDLKKAASEMRRVLVPGGRIAIAVWAVIDHNPAYAEVAGLFDDLIGADAAAAVRLPFSLGDATPVMNALTDAGCASVSLRTPSVEACFPSAQQMVEAELRGWLPLFGIELGEETIAEVLREASGRLTRFSTTDGKACFATSAHIISATRD